MTIRSPLILSLFAIVGLSIVGCGGSGREDAGVPDSGVPVDSDVSLDDGVPDAGATADLAVDTGPEPDCRTSEDCNDDDTCTTDTCENEQCVRVNPSATCERFEGGECAGELATELLTIEQTICIPAFDINLPNVADVSLCEGVRCNPSDKTDGCLITVVSSGQPSTEPAPNVLRVQGRLASIAGSVRINGSVMLGEVELPLNCNVVFGVGSGLPLAADLTLEEETMCGTDRNVSSEANVDLSMLRPDLSPVGPQDFLTCVGASALLQSQLSLLVGDVETQLEEGIEQALDGLDCGTCDTTCPADLVCRLPLR